MDRASRRLPRADKIIMELSQIVGWIATFLFTICYIPQIIKTYKTKTVEGLSFWLLLLQFMGNIIALWYATLIAQTPLQVKYVLALIFLSICLGLYMVVLRNLKKGSKLTKS